MRTLRIVVLAAGLLVLGATPVAAATVPQYWVEFTMSPVGGTPGTNINLTGQCGGVSEGDAYLQLPIRSDVVYPPADHKHFAVTNNNFSTTLQNPYGNDNQGFPTDLNVRVQCGTASQTKAYQGSNTPIGVTATVFASLGAIPCAFAFVGPGDDARVPCPTQVKGFNAAGALSQANFYIPSDDTHGASIAIGDANHDGQPDIVTGGGTGSPGALRTFKFDGTLESVTAAYGNFTGGFSVAVGDVIDGPENEVVTGAGPGGGPHVIVWSYNATQNTFDPVIGWYAYDRGFHGGVNVAIANQQIITGAGPGGGPHVKRFDGRGNELGGFYAYAAAFSGGVSVATDPATGSVVTGAGAGGGPHVRVITPGGVVTAEWYAYDASFTGGVVVGVGRATGGPNQVVTGAGAGGGPHVRIFNMNGTLNNGGWYAFAQCCGAGIRSVAVKP